ncbi:2940_t:CDS:2, partial [Gigaspora margarita]
IRGNDYYIIAHAIKKYVRIGCELTNRSDIETALQNLSGTSVARIEPNCNKTTKASALSVEQDDIETNLESLKPSPTFSKPSSKPKAAWTELFANKETSNQSVSSDELDEMLNAIRDHYSPENMHANLEALVANGNLTVEEIPTVKTIKGWIGRYGAYFKKEASEKALLESNSLTITSDESGSNKCIRISLNR